MRVHDAAVLAAQAKIAKAGRMKIQSLPLSQPRAIARSDFALRSLPSLINQLHATANAFPSAQPAPGGQGSGDKQTLANWDSAPAMLQLPVSNAHAIGAR